jgi:GNAT superfamily N-acetyltransferase
LGRHLSFEEFARELTDLPGEYGPPHGVLLLASCNGRLAGCVALRPLDEGLCEMRRLYVRHQFRGKGVGKRLSLAVIDEARERGYRAMRISLAPWMEEAIAIYHSLGFRSIEPYRPGPLNGVVFMEFQLH